MDRKYSGINSLLAEAANFIRREKEAAGYVESAEGYKRRQIEKLKEFASSRKLLGWKMKQKTSNTCILNTIVIDKHVFEKTNIVRQPYGTNKSSFSFSDSLMFALQLSSPTLINLLMSSLKSELSLI